MVKLGVGITVTVLVLAVAVGAALSGSPTSANSEDGTEGLSSQKYIPFQTSEAVGEDEAEVVEEPVDKPSAFAFLGVLVTNDLSNDAGGAMVSGVLDDGPSLGILAEGDVIVGIDGERVLTAEDVVAAVKAAKPGDVMTLSIRDKDDLQVTLGNRTPAKVNPFGRLHGGIVTPKSIMPLISKAGEDLVGQLGAMKDGFVRAEIVFETDDGFKTIRGAAGTLSNIDVGAGALTLSPKDGSDPIDYQINDDTVLKTSNTGDLSGLNTEDRTLVVDVDGEVKLVLQGENFMKSMKPTMPNVLPKGGMFRFGRGGGHDVRPVPAPGGPRFHIDPNAQNHIFEVIPFGPDGALRLEGIMGEEFDALLDSLPQELRERIERHMSEAEEAAPTAPAPSGQTL